MSVPIYGYNKNSASSAMEQLRMRHGFPRSYRFFDAYPSFVGSINPATMTDRLRTNRNLSALKLYSIEGLLGVNKKKYSAKAAASTFILDEAKRRNAATYNGFAYKVNQSLGIGRNYKSASDSAEAFSNAFSLRDSEYWDKIRAAKDIHMRRVAMSAGRRKQQQQDITKGIEGAFGKSGTKAIAKAFVLYRGASKFGNAAAFVAYGASLRHAPAMRAASQMASLSGVGVEKLSGLTYALQAFGGDEKQAASLFTKLNELQEGAKYGRVPEVFKTLAKRFGISYMQGGKIADSDTMIRRISNKLASTSDIGKRAYIARTAGLSGPELDLMKFGYDEYKKRISAASKGSPYTFGGEENAKRLAESLGIISAEFDKFNKSLVHDLTPAVRLFASWLGRVNKDSELNRAIDIAKKKAGYGIFSKPGISGDIGNRYLFFSALDELGVADEALKHFEFSDAARTYKKNYEEWKSWKKSFSTPSSPIKPIPDYTDPSTIPAIPTFYTPGTGGIVSGNVPNTINLKMDFSNFDESKMSQKTRSAFNEAGLMLLEDINPYLSPQIFMGEH
jgi:hypothetical protein